MKKLIFLLVGLLVFSFTWADFTRTFCCNTGWQDTDWSDPGLCCELPEAPVYPYTSLIGAELQITLETIQDVGLENTSLSSTFDGYAKTTLAFFITAPDITDHEEDLVDYYPGPTMFDTVFLDTYDGNTDWAGDSGTEWLDRTNSGYWSYIYTDLSHFTSPFDVCTFTASEFTIGGTGGNATGYVETQAKVTACIVYTYEGEQLPVELSSFTAMYFEGASVLQWTTQSETNNMGWNVYRSESNLFENSLQINIDLVPGYGTSSEPHDYMFEDEVGVLPGMTYWYWIEDISYDQTSNTHGPISLSVPEGGYDPVPPEILNTARLYNTPNPFNPNTEIFFSMEESNMAVQGEVFIYDIKGNLIRNLYEGIIRSDVGINWDSTDNNGKKVSSGIYLYVLKTEGKTYAKKMVLTK